MDDQVLSILQETAKNDVPDLKQASVTKPMGRLFSASQVAVATLIGSPLAGAALFARNYHMLGKNAAAWQSMALGVIGTALLIIVALLLPKGAPLALLSVIGMRQLTNHFQGRAISDHEYAGGRKGSWLVAVGVGLSGLVLVFVVAFVLAFAFFAASATL